jgi:hypothetical protein
VPVIAERLGCHQQTVRPWLVGVTELPRHRPSQTAPARPAGPRARRGTGGGRRSRGRPSGPWMPSPRRSAPPG